MNAHPANVFGFESLKIRTRAFKFRKPSAFHFLFMGKMTKKVLVTRPRAQAEELEKLLRAEGLEVLFQPVIEIGAPSDGYAALDAELVRLETFDWVVFSSTNGVEAFRDRLEVLQKSPGPTLKFAAIGPGTARVMEESGFPVHFIPEVYRAEFLAEGLTAEASRGAHFLLIRASRGREVLSETLRNAGGAVTQAVAYSSTDVTRESDAWDPEIQRLLDSGEIGWVTVTSSAIAASAVRLFGTETLSRTRLASISPLTSSALAKYSLSPAAEARDATMDSLVRAIAEAEAPT